MTDRVDKARELMAAIRRQVFVPDMTTMGPCDCGEPARGSGSCRSCLAVELDELLNSSAGTAYVYACEAQRQAERDVLRMAGDGRG